MPSFHGPRLLQWLSSANEEDEREVLIKLSISSVVIRSREEALEWLPGDVCVYGRGRGRKVLRRDISVVLLSY